MRISLWAGSERKCTTDEDGFSGMWVGKRRLPHLEVDTFGEQSVGLSSRRSFPCPYACPRSFLLVSCSEERFDSELESDFFCSKGQLANLMTWVLGGVAGLWLRRKKIESAAARGLHSEFTIACDAATAAVDGHREDVGGSLRLQLENRL